jgi:uncharacterized cupin superfamily protein
MFRQAIPVTEVPEQSSSMYPEPFRTRMGDRAKRRLGNAFGLTQYGVNLVRLGPGGQSALRHFHTHEDEFVYVLEGELTLVTNVGAQKVGAGMCVGFPANTGDAHHFKNEGTQVAVYLEVGGRVADDNAYYPDDDLAWLDGPDGSMKAVHKTGVPY